MRNTSLASIATIVAIALYFALTWGMSAFQALISPSHGLEDVWRSQFVFALGHVLHLGPIGIVKLAAFLAAMKLVTAAVCALHAIDRIRGHRRTELLEGALIVVAAVALLGCGLAVWSHSNDLLREHTVEFALAAIAIALCMTERALDREEDAAEETLALTETAQQTVVPGEA